MVRTEIGRWRLGEVLGEGGMGTVYLAHHQTLEIPAAAKLLSSRLSREPKFRERFLREARAQAQLRHPGIAQVLDFIEDGEDLCIVVEYLPGGNLEKQLEPGKPLPVEAAITWARQALEALDHAHQRGIIHRDIKPSNIMLDEKRRAKVVDFGIALVLDGGRRLTTATGSMGTPHYMSPEQIRRPHEVDHRTDVYSMGVVLYEMLTGRPPFDADSDFDIHAAQVNEPPKPLRELNPEVPEEVDAVVLQALEKNPDARYSGCGAFARALEPKQEVVEDVPPPPPPAVAQKNSHEVRWLAVGIFFLFLVLAVFGFANELKKEKQARSDAESSLAETTASLRTAETRASGFQDLVAAKSWDWVTGNDFDLLFGKYSRPTVFPKDHLANSRRMQTDSSYRWIIESSDSFNWATYGDKAMQAPGEATYLQAEVQITGTDDAYGALLFRGNGDYYYSFCINRTSYAVWLSKPAEWEVLREWTASDKIRTSGFNRLAVIADGDRLQFFINDESVDEMAGASLVSGYAGLAGGTLTGGPTITIDFDNFELRKRPSGE